MDKFETLMNIPVTKEKTIDSLIQVLEEAGKIDVVLNRYKVSKDDLRALYIQKLLIPGMTVGIAYSTMSFVAASINKGDEDDYLSLCICNCISLATIYMTNVSPEKRAELEGRK